MLYSNLFLERGSEGEELKAPRYASAAATRDSNLPSRDGKLPYVTAICLVPDTYLIIELPAKLGGKPLVLGTIFN